MSLLKQWFAGRWPALVMFDLDGTLVDSVPDLAAAVDEMLIALNRPPVGLARVREWVGNGAALLVRRALAGDIAAEGVDDGLHEQALSLFMQAYSKVHRHTVLYPQVVETLDRLRDEGIPLALVTNKPEQFIQPLLEQVGLAGRFRWIVGGDTLPRRKPEPDGLWHVLAQAAVPASQALFVGDSRNDIQAAKAAGVKSLAVRYGYNHGEPIETANPDYVVDNLYQVFAS